jgi:hypothetical protein
MKTKVSATVDVDRLQQAQQLTGSTNVSAVLDEALQALITAYLERIHTQGYERIPQGDEAVGITDASVWADAPWADE